jgi:hypothetical protein
VTPEVAVRWLILLMVLCCDPAAIALTVAAAGSRVRETRSEHADYGCINDEMNCRPTHRQQRLAY